MWWEIDADKSLIPCNVTDTCHRVPARGHGRGASDDSHSPGHSTSYSKRLHLLKQPIKTLFHQPFKSNLHFINITHMANLTPPGYVQPLCVGGQGCCRDGQHGPPRSPQSQTLGRAHPGGIWNVLGNFLFVEMGWMLDIDIDMRCK